MSDGWWLSIEIDVAGEFVSLLELYGMVLVVFLIRDKNNLNPITYWLWLFSFVLFHYI